MPSRGSPTPHSRGHHQKWPTKWANSIRNPCYQGVPGGLERAKKNRSGPPVGRLAIQPLPSGGCLAPQSGGQIRSGQQVRTGPQVSILATQPPPSRGASTPESGGHNQKWPTNGQIGYVTPPVPGVPNASKRGSKAELANKWADWLRNPPFGCPQRLKVGDKINCGPQVGGLATQPLPFGGYPTPESGEQYLQSPTFQQKIK